MGKTREVIKNMGKIFKNMGASAGKIMENMEKADKEINEKMKQISSSASDF